MLFFTHANSKHFGSLVANGQNDFVGGVDKYPKTVSKAYDMLVNFVNPNKSYSANDQDGGMSFYQEGSNRNTGCGGNNRNTSGGHGRGGPSNCNQSNSGGANDGNDNNHANVATVEEDQDVGSSNNNSTNSDA